MLTLNDWDLQSYLEFLDDDELQDFRAEIKTLLTRTLSNTINNHVDLDDALLRDKLAHLTDDQRCAYYCYHAQLREIIGEMDKLINVNN